MAVFLGQGTFNATLVAKIDLSKMDFNLTLTSILFPSSLTTGIILNGKFTFSVTLYDISSKTPSGGTKVIALSLSNLGNFTH